MSKTASSWSKSARESTNWGARADLDGLTAEWNFAESSNSIVGDKLIYVHANFGFYYKCTNNRALYGSSIRTECARIIPTSDGDS
jgi:hypothetical protein